MAISEAALAAIAAGATATGAIGSAGIAGARNMKIARYSADFQREQIREQNEYNSPAAQMARYKEAGLNPNLIYGEGQASAGNQSQVAQYHTPELPTPDLGNLMASSINVAMAFKNQKAELALKEQELLNKREEQFNIRSERMARDIDNMYNAIITGFDPGLVSSKEERDRILGGMRVGRYHSEILGVQELNSYRRAVTSFTKAQEKLSGLKSDAQSWYNQNIQPLIKQTMEKAVEGRGIQNEILEIEKRFRTFDKYFGYGNAILNDILSGIKAFSGFGGGSLPYAGSALGSWSPSFTY